MRSFPPILYCFTSRQKPYSGSLGTSGDSACYYSKTLGFSGETASQGLFCMFGFAPEVVAPPAEVADFDSFSIFSFSFLPQWSRSKWWSSFSRGVSHDISPGRVNEREGSFFSQRFSVFYPLAHPFPALDVLPNSLRLLSLVSILSPSATPLTWGARVPFHLVGDVVAL